MQHHALANRTILLVEDERLVAKHISRVLKGRGAEVLHCCSGEDAVQTVAREAVDLVLMDIELGPGRMDGAEAAEAILQNHDLPLVFISAHTGEDVVQKIDRITSYGYIVKNTGDAVLLTSVKMALRLFDSRRESAGSKGRLQQLETQLQFVFQNIPVLFYTYEDGMGSTFYSPLAEGFLGYSQRDFEKDPMLWHRSIHPDDLPKIDRALFQAADDEVNTFEYRVRDANGNWHWFLDSFRRRKTEDGSYISDGVVIDITERRKTEQKLQESETEKQAILDGISFNLLFVDTDFKIKWANRAAADSVNSSAEQLVNRKCYLFWGEDGKSCPHCPVRKAFASKQTEHAVYTTPGGHTWRIMGEPVFDPEGNLVGAIDMAEEITDRKQIEDELKQTVAQKNDLLQEMNHRIKNNLAMITSLISLKSAGPGSGADLSDLRRQIDAIRIVHERLYQTEDITEIDVREYIGELLSGIFSSFSTRPVTVENSMDAVILPTKTAIPLGLISNEIATNALKHGFPGIEETPVFRVRMKQNRQEGECVLVLNNNGAPIPESMNLQEPGTLGLRLVCTLVDQLQGGIDIKRAPHPEFTIRFPLQD